MTHLNVEISRLNLKLDYAKETIIQEERTCKKLTANKIQLKNENAKLIYDIRMMEAASKAITIDLDRYKKDLDNC